MEKYLALLGYPVHDKITGLRGVVVSVSFDLYGCVQCIVHPGVDPEKGTMRDSVWVDWKRLEKTAASPVMPKPSFAGALGAEPGPEPKPHLPSMPTAAPIPRK